MNLKIRAAVAADGPALTRLVRTSAAYDGEYRAMISEQTIDAAYLEKNPARVVEDDGQLAGFYTLLIPGRGEPGEGELDYLFVADDQQGAGIGRLLMTDLRREAARLGLRRIHIVSHPPSEGFYLAVGARRVGVRPARGRVTWSQPILVLDLPKIEVRRATPGDGAAIGVVHAASWEAAYAPFFDKDFAAGEIASRLTRWHERVTDPQGLILLAEQDGRPLAFSWAVPSSQRAGLAEIYSFYAHPDGWGSGVAAALMAETLGQLRAEGLTAVHLWTLRDTPQSRRFYEKSGFRETGATTERDFGDGAPLPQVEYEVALMPRMP
ncbi:N-acetyltransferase family protein [Kribbella sp. CA-294648]|uniref:GNAT family N-acetyltransferase n=1 Tax=Kribbella sp. CA-294648 TaxID=3239948 RepID=UPI003D91D814